MWDPIRCLDLFPVTLDVSSEGFVKTVSICPGLSESTMLAEIIRSKISFTGSKTFFQHKIIFFKNYV